MVVRALFIGLSYVVPKCTDTQISLMQQRRCQSPSASLYKSISLFLAAGTNPLWTIASVYQLFWWKEPCQDSCWHTSLVSWISTADQGVTHFPLSSEFLHLFKAWENAFDVTAAHTQQLAPFPLCAGARGSKTSLWFYSWTLMICCREHWRSFLVRFCWVITGFPLALLPWRRKHSWLRNVRGEGNTESSLSLH